MSARPMLVTCKGSEMRLTREEYDELKRLADEDPVEADRLGRAYLRRELAELSELTDRLTDRAV